jgi:class 3 adenylate cyclase
MTAYDAPQPPATPFWYPPRPPQGPFYRPPQPTRKSSPATAIAACRTCGTEPLEHARFCHGCGSPVEDVGTRAEYKQVTVLFADVVHSMDIAAAVGEERLREIMTELVNRVSSVVQHFGGTVDKFTGDGIMAVFGAPVALEDHAVRGCLAALDIQKETQRLAAQVDRHDGITLQLRVGLNSGGVIAGEIGSGAFGYTAVGEQVGMAQRMESVAPPGGVMLSESTARLVEHAPLLADAETVHIKGSDAPVVARRLLGVGAQREPTRSSHGAFLGRELEVATITGLLDRSMSGRGCVVCVAGPAGIGKTRLADETAATARRRGVEVFWVLCESHASDVPFHVAARLLRDAAGVTDLDDEAARAQVRAQVSEAADEDVLLLYDLLGIRDPDVALPNIDPDARRRRLTALINSVSLARTAPALYIIEDAHWIDEVSESMFADFLAVIPQTHSVVLITYRSEYRGALAQMTGAQTISLAPLSDSETTTLLDEVLGPDPSVAGIRALIAGRAAGNPFFAQEMVRELAERGVLEGHRGGYRCRTDVAEITVPATLQAAIAARIDRLDAQSKQTLNAAAVIGSRFTPELLAAVGNDPVLDALLRAELIDQVRFTPSAEFAFRHPLIRTVAYESQLRSDRAKLHRRLATAIQQRDSVSVDENAALIAEHLEAAGDLRAAFDWHMRAGAWSTNRDIVAARTSWRRARQAADRLPDDDPDRMSMRIAPRALLCGNAFRMSSSLIDIGFEELRDLCTAAGDQRSLAIGMTGLIAQHYIHGRVRHASRVGSELMALVESIGDPNLTVGLAFTLATTKFETGEMAEALRWSQTVIDLAQGDPAKGNIVIGSPLAVALATRGTARYALGDPGWRDDLNQAVAMARGTDPWTRAYAVIFACGAAVEMGVLLADDVALREIEEALSIAERSGDDLALSNIWLTMGVVLMHRDSPADRERGLVVLGQVRDLCLDGRYYPHELWAIDVYTARERAGRGDRDVALPLMREAVDKGFRTGQFGHCDAATGALVETLLDRGADGDITEAEAAITRLAAAPADEGLVIREVWLLRLRALLAQACGDEAAYRGYRDRYRALAKSLGFEGHTAWAEAMP